MGGLFKKFHPPFVESVPKVGDLHPMMPGSVIVASVGSGPQLPHTDIATHPEPPPPYGRNISGCHLSSFLCLSEEYQVRVQAGTALGEAAEVRWDTIELQRGDMLLMVATSRHHGMLALPGARDGLQGAFLTCGSPTPSTATTNPTPPTSIPLPPLKPWPLLVTYPAGTAPTWTRCRGWGKGPLGGWVCGKGMLPRPCLLTPPRCPRRPPPRAPTTPPTFLSCFAPADVLAMLEVAEHSVLFFAGLVHQLEVTKDGTVDEGEAINFAISGIAPPPPRPAQPRCGTWGTTPQRGKAPSARVPGPGPSTARAIVRCAPCAIPRVCLLFQQIRTNFVRISCPRMFGASVGMQKFLWDSYEICTSFVRISANLSEMCTTDLYTRGARLALPRPLALAVHAASVLLATILRVFFLVPLPNVRRSFWATTAVPSRPLIISGSSILLSTPVLMTMAALPPALLCPGNSVPPLLLSAAQPPACSRPHLNRLNGPERSPAATPGRAPRLYCCTPYLHYSPLFSSVRFVRLLLASTLVSQCRHNAMAPGSHTLVAGP